MTYTPKILAFAGSARSGSFNKMLVKVAADGARKAGAQVTYLDLRDLPMPLFDQDLEERDGEHPNAKAFKDLLRAHDGVLLSSPENNSTYSALLKNAIDWASRKRPGEQPLECFAGKVACIMSASPGPFGGLRGIIQLRTLLSNIRFLVLPDQLTVSGADKAFDADGRLKDPKLQEAAERLGALLAGTLAKLKA